MKQEFCPWEQSHKIKNEWLVSLTFEAQSQIETSVNFQFGY